MLAGRGEVGEPRCNYSLNLRLISDINSDGQKDKIEVTKIDCRETVFHKIDGYVLGPSGDEIHYRSHRGMRVVSYFEREPHPDTVYKLYSPSLGDLKRDRRYSHLKAEDINVSLSSGNKKTQFSIGDYVETPLGRGRINHFIIDLDDKGDTLTAAAVCTFVDWNKNLPFEAEKDTPFPLHELKKLAKLQKASTKPGSSSPKTPNTE